jgi:hypothetical protein
MEFSCFDDYWRPFTKGEGPPGRLIASHARHYRIICDERISPIDPMARVLSRARLEPVAGSYRNRRMNCGHVSVGSGSTNLNMSITSPLIPRLPYISVGDALVNAGALRKLIGEEIQTIV